MKNIKNLFIKYTYGNIISIGSIRTIGYKPVDEYFIDKTTYLFGIPLKTKRFWKLEDFIKPNKRINVKGYKRYD